MRPAAVGAGLTLAVLASGCGTSAVSAPRLAASIGEAFTRLYQLQQVQEGHPRPSISSLQTRASCRRGRPGSPQHGAGNDWSCQIVFLVAGPATPVTALYSVNVQTDGCYAADGDGPASVNGSLTLTAPDGTERINPLRLIDGCFEAG